MSLELDLDLQVATTAAGLSAHADFAHWVEAAVADRRARCELTIRLVDAAESQALNAQYRGVDRSTNVLSFPFELPPGVDSTDPLADYIGDLVICPEVVQREALEQGKQAIAHWAHMVVHGVLHLFDYDHITDEQAAEMEGLETTILSRLGFPPPYEDDPPTEDP
ncbi:rRNA maturation RNase YbeY [Marichromatium sp. PS1]|uniref:rRNA maturation RNase YbeY n=1 Tax=Marichromatium sp. PS1 TaxID=3138932 RepID=UPI0032E7CF93